MFQTVSNFWLEKCVHSAACLDQGCGRNAGFVVATPFQNASSFACRSNLYRTLSNSSNFNMRSAWIYFNPTLVSLQYQIPTRKGAKMLSKRLLWSHGLNWIPRLSSFYFLNAEAPQPVRIKGLQWVVRLLRSPTPGPLLSDTGNSERCLKHIKNMFIYLILKRILKRIETCLLLSFYPVFLELWFCKPHLKGLCKTLSTGHIPKMPVVNLAKPETWWNMMKHTETWETSTSRVHEGAVIQAPCQEDDEPLQTSTGPWHLLGTNFEGWSCNIDNKSFKII